MKHCSTKWRIARKIIVAVLLLAALVGLGAWYELFREEPQHFESQLDRFKYGSIGTEANEGIPYWIWVVLPRVFPSHLPGPGGYASLGIVWEEGKETPVGFSKKTIGFPRIGINCAVCHAGTYRTEPGLYSTVVAGAPATRIDVLGYQHFLFDCASDPRFNADEIMPAIEYNVNLSPVDKLLYRALLIPQTRKALIEAKNRLAWTSSRPPWGRGRIDPFNPVKFHQLKMDPTGDNTIGNSDMEPIWSLLTRTGHFHWDGLNDSITEVVMSGAIGDGATKESLPAGDMERLESWLMRLPPPKYPFLDKVDSGDVKKGADLFQARCAVCHAGSRTGTVIPYSELLTDHHRIDMWSQQAADIYNKVPLKPPLKFEHFQKHEGYVAVPLNGLWLRAPYLHNGSVPTFEDLLKPASQRPKVFYRGYDVYIPNGSGFIYEKSKVQGLTFEYDTAVQGNSNVGHDGPAYGTDLNENERAWLVAYLKTL